MADANFRETPFQEGHLASLVNSLLFKGWDHRDLKRFVELTEPTMRQYGSGEVVFKEGDSADGLYVIVDGRIGAYQHDADGIEQQILHLSTPWSIGHAAILDSKASLGPVERNATVRIISDEAALFVYIPNEGIRTLEETSADLGMQFYRSLCGELHKGRNITNVGLRDGRAENAALRAELDELRRMGSSGAASVGYKGE